MTQLPLILDDGGNDNTPLPLIVANRWNFPLAHIQTDDGLVYAVQDWMRGLLGKDTRNLLSMMRSANPQFNSGIKLLPYRTANNKVYQLPYADEDKLMWILVNARRNRGRSRLVDIRNFIAGLAPEYEYLKCSSVKDSGLTEYEFQTTLITALKPMMDSYEICEFYPTASGRVIDILVIKKDSNQENSAFEQELPYLLIECKVNREEFYKAIGQLVCYDAEISGRLLSADNRTLAIAMPYEIIDDYILNIVTTLSVRLISVVQNIAIDAVTGEPFCL
jgi:hypothetical protein